MDLSPLLHLSKMEWMNVFESKKPEAQIDKTDKEIDQMVYELYELTEKEIQTVDQ